MDQEWFEKTQRLYDELMRQIAAGVECMVSSLLKGLPMDATLLGALGQVAPHRVPLEACYHILGLSPSATDQEVHRRYQELAKRLHPDVAGPETAHLFGMVAAAYQEIEKERHGTSNG